MSSIQQQISKLQSQLDSKRSKTPTRKNEKMNSSQRRKSKSPKRGKSPSLRKMTSDHVNNRRKDIVLSGGDFSKLGEPMSIDFSKARALGHNALSTAKQLLDKLNKAHNRAREAKLDVWDHTKRVTLETKSKDGKPMTRYQTYAEWKMSKPKPSLLTQLIKCKHNWKMFSNTPAGREKPWSYCTFCNVREDELKDEKNENVIIEQLQELYDTACQEFEVARNALRAGLGTRPVRIQLTSKFVITTTVTTGVTRTVDINGGGTGALSPKDATEYSSIAAIFDEVKTTHGKCEFIYINTVAANGTTSAVTTDSLPVIAYDPSTSSPAISATSDGVQFAQHMLFNPLTGTTTGNSANGCKHTFPWRVPPGVTSANGTQSIVGTQWQSVEGTLLPVGGIVFYHVGTCVTATNTGAGFVYYENEFRCRE